MPTTILLVEDDLKLGALLQDYLRDQGFAVDWERRGDRAIDRILMDRPGLVLLDLALPGVDGLGVCRAVRDAYRGPILMLTARRSTAEQIEGLESGANDYILKPVEPRLLLARVRAALRPPRPSAGTRCEVGELHLDRARRAVSVGAYGVALTGAEFELLWLLACRAGEVVSREELFREALGVAWDGVDRGVDVYVSRIRRKLAGCGFDRSRLKSIRGAGYLLSPL